MESSCSQSLRRPLLIALLIASTSVFASGYSRAPQYNPRLGAPTPKRRQRVQALASKNQFTFRSDAAYGPRQAPRHSLEATRPVYIGQSWRSASEVNHQDVSAMTQARLPDARSLSLAVRYDSHASPVNAVSRSSMTDAPAWRWVVEELALSDGHWNPVKEIQKLERAIPRIGAHSFAECASLSLGLPDDAKEAGRGFKRFALVERVEEKTVLLSWAGSTCGRFTDRRWTLSRSRGEFRCAMSGMKISRGEFVYRPAPQRGEIRVEEDVILASVIDSVALDQSTD